MPALGALLEEKDLLACCVVGGLPGGGTGWLDELGDRFQRTVYAFMDGDGVSHDEPGMLRASGPLDRIRRDHHRVLLASGPTQSAGRCRRDSRLVARVGPGRNRADLAAATRCWAEPRRSSSGREHVVHCTPARDHLRRHSTFAARKAEHAKKHGAGQIGLLAALALFGVDYFTSYYYAAGEMMSALHPYGLQQLRLHRRDGDRLCQLRLWRSVHVFAGDLQRRRRLLHGIHALSLADAEPDRGRHIDPGLCSDDRGLRALGGGSTAFDPECVQLALDLALCHRRRPGRHHLVSHDPRARATRPGSSSCSSRASAS